MKGLSYHAGFVATLGVILLMGWSLRNLGVKPSLTFSKPFLDATTDEILVGNAKEFVIDLRNPGTTTVTLEAIESSCRSAKSRVDGGFPTLLPPASSLPVSLMVTADSARVGVQELGFKARGRSRGQVVDSEFRLAVKIVDYANADPVVVSYGTISRTTNPVARTVALWTPRNLPAPAIMEVVTHDPCLSINVSRTEDWTDDQRHFQFAELEITLDPRKAPPALRDDIVIKTTANQLRVPVLASVDTASTEE